MVESECRKKHSVRHWSLPGRRLSALVLLCAGSGAWADVQWELRSPMPFPAGQAAIVRGNDGRFYLFGGWNTNPPTVSQSRRVQIYDPVQDAWSLGTNVPVYCIGDSAVVAPSGQIHLLNAYFQRVYPYDPATDTWLPPRAAPWMTYSARAARTPEGRYFVFGGERPASLTYEYFPDTFTGLPRAEVPYAAEPPPRSIRYPGVYVETGDDIFVIGGLTNLWTAYGAFDDVAAYHPSTDDWSENLAPMPTARFSFGFVRGWNGFLYAIGGSTSYFLQTAPYYDVVECYDPKANKWHKGTPLPEGRREAAAAIDDAGVIYVFGGSGPPSGAYTTTVYAYDTRVGIAGPAPADFDRDGDVDAADLDRFETCATGPAAGPLADGCEAADLDHDGDADQRDFGLFQACVGGPDLRADPDCEK